MIPVENIPSQECDPDRQKKERRAFLFLAVVLAPALSITLVGGYGFVIWMLQLLLGPPAA